MVAARYIAAIGCVATSLGLRYLLSDYLGPNVPYLQFFPAILVASWYGGFGPGVLATALSAFAALYWFIGPAGALTVADALTLSLFTLIGIAIASLNGRLREARDLARHEANHVERDQPDRAARDDHPLLGVASQRVGGQLVGVDREADSRGDLHRC